MKEALEICTLAMNPLAPSPTAGMVKIEDGHMTAFGGTACVRVPVPVDVGACFNPAVFAGFFRKNREAVSYTLNKGKLVLKEGKEKLSLPFLPPEEMVTLDVLAKPVKASLSASLLKLCADAIQPDHFNPECQGVNFRDGVMEATDRRLLVSAESGLPDELAFNLPLVTAKILLKIKSNVVAVAAEKAAVKFFFENGMSVCSVLIGAQLQDTSPLYQHEWSKMKISEEFAKDAPKIVAESFAFKEGNVTYKQETSEGVIGGVCDKGVSTRMSKRVLDFLLKVSPDIRVSANGSLLMAVSDRCRAIGVCYSS
jgi:hypothetical protein